MGVIDIKTGQRMSISQLRKLGVVGKGKSPRHVIGQMNKTETAFSEFAQTHKLAGLILDWWFESVTLLLATDLRYTPDFLIMEIDYTLSLIEVKPSYTDKEGKAKVFSRDGAIEKLKLAARKFPFRFKLAVRQPDKSWIVKEIV